MRLWLARHGRPDIDDRRPIRGSEFRAWVDAYDAAPLDPGVGPGEALCEIARSAGCIATSPLRRSLESAGVLDPSRPLVTEAHFREAEIPGVPLPFRFGPQAWAKLARMAWVAGWSPGIESFGQSRARAGAAAAQLDRLANDHGSVMLVAHGMINGFIAASLRARGWSGPSAFGGDYWACHAFEKRGD